MSLVELLLADGRFPSGSFAHSGGLEPAVGASAIGTVGDLEAFTLGRLTTSGPLEAWLAARAATLDPSDLAAIRRLEAEAEAHQPSPALRQAARAQGRGLRRAATVLFPAFEGCPAEVLPVVTGLVAGVAGLDPAAAARLALHGLVLSIVSAAPKLLPIDMVDALAIALRLAPLADELARDATVAETCPIASAPLTEQRAEAHATWEVRLFAS